MARESTKAVAYLRTSSRTNVGPDKDSDKRHFASIEAYAKTAGLEIVATFYDAAVSGAGPGRVAHRTPSGISEQTGSVLVILSYRGLAPCLNQRTIDHRPNRRRLDHQLSLPISPTSLKTPTPSCSRLLTPERTPTRLRA